MALIDKLTAIGDGFRSSRGTDQKYTLDEMAVLAAEPEAPPAYGVTLTDKLTALADGFRLREGTEQKYTLDEMAVMAAESINRYEPLLYIQSSGTQYIDTGYCPTANTRVVADVYILNPDIANRFYGERGGSTGFDCMTTAEGRWQVFHGDVYKTDSVSYAALNSRYTIDQNGATVKLTCSFSSAYNRTITVSSTWSGECTNPMYIFTFNNNGTPSYRAAFRLYSFKIYEGDVLVRDFVPVRRSDGVNGLLDNVSETFYTNAGTGAFMSNLAEDAKSVPSGYKQLSYIESNGTQYIDTGFKPTAYTRVSTKLYYMAATDYEAFYGVRVGESQFAAYAYNNYFFIHYGDDVGSISSGGKATYTLDHQGSMAFLGVGSSSYLLNCENPTFSGENSHPMYIFAFNNGTKAYSLSTIRMYHLKIYNEGVLVRWFVPVQRESDGEVGMYDLVEDKFYANAGTGSFIASS